MVQRQSLSTDGLEFRSSPQRIGANSLTSFRDLVEQSLDDCIGGRSSAR